MVLPPKSDHPMGDQALATRNPLSEAVEVDTYAGKLHVEWDSNAAVTPMGQLPFFIQFLKLGGRFDPWVRDCPLHYRSNNAPEKVNVLGSLFLSILSGHNRYSHITNLMSDRVNSRLLGMTKVVSDDSARRGLNKIDEKAGIEWLQKHLQSCYEPLLTTPWILDVDVTVKPLYGHQEGAKKGYNPQKPGRPSHTYHTYMMGNLRLVLDVEVQSGDQSNSCHSMPGLISLLHRLPANGKPAFVRGDIAWGTDNVMTQLEEIYQHYLFKLKKSVNVKNLIYKHHELGEWFYINKAWEAKEDVVVVNNKGEIINTELLIWDRKKELLSSDKFVKIIDQHDRMPWSSGFNDTKEKEAGFSFSNLPINYASKKFYRGINALVLSMYRFHTEETKGKVYITSKGFEQGEVEMIEDDRLFWLTFKQIKEAGGKLKKDSLSQQAIYYNWIFSFHGKTISEQKYKELKKQFGCTPSQYTKGKGV